MKLKQLIKYFSKGEIMLWLFSVIFITVSFLVFDRENYLTLSASIIGITALIFCAKGNPIGQALIIIFSGLYGAISYKFAYYGEMITYLGMSAPMAVIALVSWLRHPYMGKVSEVKVNHIKKKELAFIFVLSLFVTFIFYFILGALGTSNLITSTFSVTTSFLAVCLSFRRSAYYALAYALNDVVLIVLWIMAMLEDISYVSVVVCFTVFLINDIYGFLNWIKMGKEQKENRS